MSTFAAASPAVKNIEQLKAGLRATWMAGNYDIFSRYMESDAILFFRRIGIQPSQRVLDVGCGTGQFALIAARAGAHVNGCDISANWIARARERAQQENLSACFEEADAEALPYRDAQFDVVASLIGAMFAPRPDCVAAELTRVCRPGGTIAMANWTAQGFVGKMFKTISKYIAPNGMPSPLLWGDENVVRERFQNGILDVQCKLRFYQFEYPFPPETVVEFFRENYGPMSRAFDSLDPQGQARLKAELVELWASHNRAVGNGTLVDAEYLEVIALRGDDLDDSSICPSGLAQHHRAMLLADRVEEGAARLEDFARSLTDAEWNTSVIEGGKLGRSVGVIVHHVASVYPIEVDLARTIASGQQVTHVTWELVSELNAEHATRFGNASRAETFDLLRKNSKEAADAVRNFTDAELDRAAPFSLSFGAPITAQFVLEDHAVRHSWHHLDRIRKALGHGGPMTSLRLQ